MSYHDIDAISRSAIMDFRSSPELYYGRYVSKQIPGKAATPAMAFGTMVDNFLTLNIPPTRVPDNVSVGPETRQGNAWKEFATDHKGEELWTGTEYSRWMEQQVANLEICKRIKQQIIDAGFKGLVFGERRQCQHALVWPCGIHTFMAKSLPDIINPSRGLIVDLKTSADTSAEHFCRQVARFGYDLQAYMMVEGYRECYGKTLPCVFVVIRNCEPYDVEVYELSGEWLGRGYEMFQRGVCDIENCHETGIWRSKTHGQVTRVDAPRWLKYVEEYECD